MSYYTASLCTGFSVLLIYLAIVFFAASKYIRLSNQRWLEAHEAAFHGRLRLATGGHDEVDAAIAVLLPPKSAKRRRFVPDLSDWIGSGEISRWVRLHEAQRLEICRLPEEELAARFARAMGQIDELSVVRQNAWQGRWVDLQDSSDNSHRLDARSLARWRAELSQLLAELFNARDSTYNQLVSLYGKAGLLVFAAYLPVAALLVAGYGPVLLAGFLGGLVSRMQRLVYAQGRPTAYGTSWVPLFLAPLLGALAAWAGLHLLALMQALGIVSLASVLPADADFRMLPGTALLGLAVLLGFSERFFNQLGDQADRLLSDDKSTGSPAAAGSPAATRDVHGRTDDSQRGSGAAYLQRDGRRPSAPAQDEEDGVGRERAA